MYGHYESRRESRHDRSCAGRRGHSRHGHHGHGRRGYGGGDGMGPDDIRAGRMLAQGDVRLIALALIAEAPRHGYEIIKLVEEKTADWYSPSPGIIYPTLTYLEEAGHVTAATEGSKRLYTITEEGRAFLAANRHLADAVLARLTAIGESAARMRRASEDERNSRRSLPVLVDAALTHLRETVGRRLADDAEAEARLVEILARRRSRHAAEVTAAGLDRHPHDRAQTAKRRVAERNVAAVRSRDVARDRQPQPGAAFVLVARVVEPQERLEHVLAQRHRNARPVVVDRHVEPAVIAMAGDRYGGRKAPGVGHEIGEAPLECRRPHRDLRPAVEGDGRPVAVTFGVELQLFKHGGDIGRRRLLADDRRAQRRGRPRACPPSRRRPS